MILSNECVSTPIGQWFVFFANCLQPANTFNVLLTLMFRLADNILLEELWALKIM